MQRYTIALYIRLSMEDSKYDSMSIENQRMILNEFALSMPEAENADIREFVDNGFTGTNFERPAAQELLSLVRENKIDCIIVKDFSRFGRNSLEVGYFIERVFPLFHTRFISLSDDFDSNRFKGDTGGMDVAFKYLISEYYSRDMSIKTKSAKYAKMERGEYQSKICPYGYKKSADGRMEIDEEAATVVRLIFELAAMGTTAAAITRELKRRAIPTPGEYKAARGNHTHDTTRSHGIWSSSTVLHILEDERYIGTYVIGKRAVIEVGGTKCRLKDRDKWHIIPNHHQAIVDKALFDKVQETVRRFSLPNKKAHDYLLKGRVFCGCCDHALSRGMQKVPYYQCRHSEADETLRCHGMRIGIAELEQVIFDTLKKQISMIGTETPHTKAAISGHAEKQYEYERQISDLQDEKMRLYEQLLSGEITNQQYVTQKTELDASLTRTKNAYAAVTAQTKQAQESHAEEVQRQNIIQEISTADGLNPAIADMLIEKVYVFPDKRIEIVYKIKDIFESVI